LETGTCGKSRKALSGLLDAAIVFNSDTFAATLFDDVVFSTQPQNLIDCEG
jgi:hypothetical protein